MAKKKKKFNDKACTIHVSLPKRRLVITLPDLELLVQRKGRNVSASCHSWADDRTNGQQTSGAEGGNKVPAQAKERIGRREKETEVILNARNARMPLL